MNYSTAKGRCEFIGGWTVDLKKDFLEVIKEDLLCNGKNFGIWGFSLEEVNLEESGFEWVGMGGWSFSDTLDRVFALESKDLAKVMLEQNLSVFIKYVDESSDFLYEAFGSIFPVINKTNNTYWLSYIEEIDDYSYTQALKRFGLC